MTWGVFWNFISLLPSFWSLYLKWQSDREGESFDQYIQRREAVIQMLKGVGDDPKKAFAAAVAAQRLLRAGK